MAENLDNNKDPNRKRNFNINFIWNTYSFILYLYQNCSCNYLVIDLVVHCNVHIQVLTCIYVFHMCKGRPEECIRCPESRALGLHGDDWKRTKIT